MSDAIYYGSPDPFGSYGERPVPSWADRDARPAVPEETADIPASDRLQELLSRAVEDQVSEQRALLMSLEDIRVALARFEGPSQDEMRATVVSATGEATSRLSDQVRYLTDRLEEVSRRVDDNAVATRSALEGLAAGRLEDVADLVDGMAGVRTDLRSLPEQLGPGIVSALSVGLEEVRRQVAAQGDSLAVTRSEVGRLNERTQVLDELSARTEVLPQLPAAIGALGERMREGLTDVRGAVDRAGAVAAVTDELAALRTDVNRLATSVADQTLVSGQLGGVVREGVRDAVRDFVRDTLRDAVREVVTVTTRDTERRLAAHVDEAVLMLAQALLRRRSAPSYGGVNLLPSGGDLAPDLTDSTLDERPMASVVFHPASAPPAAEPESPAAEPESPADLADDLDADPDADTDAAPTATGADSPWGRPRVDSAPAAELAPDEEPEGSSSPSPFTAAATPPAFSVLPREDPAEPSLDDPDVAPTVADLSGQVLHDEAPAMPSVTGTTPEAVTDPVLDPEDVVSPLLPPTPFAPSHAESTPADTSPFSAPSFAPDSFAPESFAPESFAPESFSPPPDFGNDPLGTGELGRFFEDPPVGGDAPTGEIPPLGATDDLDPLAAPSLLSVTLPPVGDSTAALPPVSDRPADLASADGAATPAAGDLSADSSEAGSEDDTPDPAVGSQEIVLDPPTEEAAEAETPKRGWFRRG
jgi:hypothetical protein